MDASEPVVATDSTDISRAAEPVSAAARIASLDVLRGVALLGILPMNIQAFSMIGAAYLNPTAYGDLHGANFWVWYLSHLLADQKFMSIFSMLFGAGIFLMTGRIEARQKPAAAIHYRRMAWLVLFGLLHGYLLWYGDILFNYGLCGMLAYLFRKMPPRRLIVIGLAFVTVPTVIFSFSGWSFPHWPPEKAAEFTREMWRPTPEMVSNELAAYRSRWIGEMPRRFDENTTDQLQGFVFLSLWRIEGMMLIGIALFQLAFFTAKASARLYWSFVLAGVFVGIPVIAYGTHRDFATGWHVRESFFFNFQFNYWASILVALGWASAVMLACRSSRLERFTAPFAAVGRMAFTNYLLDTFICTFVFYGFGLGLFGKVSRVQQVGFVLTIWALQLIVSPIWLRHFQFGPFEWLWRSLTYLKQQPFRRERLERGALARTGTLPIRR
jgi:uncharacterized protein